jgi:nitrite reductase (NADH) small subunit
MSFFEICSLDDLVENSGVCVLVADQQVALFWLLQPGSPGVGESPVAGEVFAIGNFDPFGGANVLSRGILGSIGDKLVVASPLYKQHFCLRSGQCLQDPTVSVPVYPVMLNHNKVLISSQPLPVAAVAA